MTISSGNSFIYVMEYHDPLNLFDLSRTEGSSLYYFNVSCAVCMTKGTVNQAIKLKITVFRFYEYVSG